MEQTVIDLKVELSEKFPKLGFQAWLAIKYSSENYVAIAKLKKDYGGLVQAFINSDFEKELGSDCLLEKIKETTKEFNELEAIVENHFEQKEEN